VRAVTPFAEGSHPYPVPAVLLNASLLAISPLIAPPARSDDSVAAHRCAADGQLAAESWELNWA
jgi:hypothetical protein